MMRAWEWLRAHPWAGWVGGAVALSVASFAAGRFAAPTRVETRETTREVKVVDEKVVEARIAQARTEWEKNVVDHTRVETRYIEGKPSVRIEYRDRDTTSSGGTTKVETVYVDREKIVYQDREVVKEKLVEREAPRFMLGATVGAGFNAGGLLPPSYGLIATGRVWGPLTVGIQGEANALQGSARLIGGLSF